MTNPTPPGQVPDALLLADECGYELAPGTRAEIAAELLRLHTENEALRAQQDDAYDHGPQAETVEEAARDVGKWLNERPNRPLDLRHVAMLTHHAKRTAHVQNPAEIEHVAGDVSKNGAESNTSTQQTAPANQQAGEVSDAMVLAALRVQYPAAYGQYLRHPANGPKTSLRTESEIDAARRMIAAALSAAPQPSPTAQAAQQAVEGGDAQDAARWHRLAEYLVGTRTDLDDGIIASATVDELRKLVDADLAAIKQ